MASELIRSPSTGLTRRTTIGKRWLVVFQQDEASKCELLTFASREKAEQCSNRLYRSFRPDVHYVEQAESVEVV